MWDGVTAQLVRVGQADAQIPDSTSDKLEPGGPVFRPVVERRVRGESLALCGSRRPGESFWSDKRELLRRSVPIAAIATSRRQCEIKHITAQGMTSVEELVWTRRPSSDVTQQA